MAVFGSATLTDRRYENAIIATILVLVGVRLICAAVAPLSFEEGDYWIWSRHIAGGYYDQPPIDPILIRLGTTLFGNSELGVRFFGVLLALPTSWAIWRTGAILFDDERVGATAALYLNLTLVLAAGSIIATPDAPLVAATAFLMLAMAKLGETKRARWWLAIGVSFGLGMVSKYTTFFFAVSILAWLLLVPELRKWLFTPWPWLAGLLAFAIFTPTFIWNAQHHWSSFVRQYNRTVVHAWTLRDIGPLFASQIGMATPPIFVLGCMGLVRLFKGEGGSHAARVLVHAMVWPIAIYFTWHSLHGRVEGNWPEPAFVPFVIAAAVAVEITKWDGVWANVASWSQRLAVPVGLTIAGCLYLQAIFGVVPFGSIDPTARALGAGWKELGVQIDQVRMQLGAPIVLSTDHGLTGWLSFYLPSHPDVEQIGARIRYVNAPQPDPALFRGTMMYVCQSPCRDLAKIHRRFATMEPVAHLARTRRGVSIAAYDIYKLAGPIGPVLDPP